MTAAELRALIAGATPGEWGQNKYCGIGSGPFFKDPVIIDSCGFDDTRQGDIALIVALVNHAERFAELLAAEEAKAESRREWTSCRPCDGWDYRVDGVYAGQVWPSSSGEWWWCLRDNLDNGIEPTQLLARAAVEAAVRAGR